MHKLSYLPVIVLYVEHFALLVCYPCPPTQTPHPLQNSAASRFPQPDSIIILEANTNSMLPGVSALTQAVLVVGEPAALVLRPVLEGELALSMLPPQRHFHSALWLPNPTAFPSNEGARLPWYRSSTPLRIVLQPDTYRSHILDVCSRQPISELSRSTS